MTNAADRSIVEFIDHARSKGMDHATIRMLLLSAGWKEKDIARAMSAHGLELPIPAPPDVGGAREGFMHLVTFAALYTAVISAVSLVFGLINLALPDPAVTRYVALQAEALRDALRWQIAAIVVAFPVVLWLSRALLREMRAAPEKLGSGVRRWLTYLTLFAAAVAVGVDLITLLSSALGGELSIRFLLKVATVLAAAGAVFAYYFVSLRQTPEDLRQSRLHQRYAWGATAAALVVVAGGIWANGTPLAARVAQFDARRVEDVRLIQREVMRASYGDGWAQPDATLAQRAPLPASLDDVVRNARGARPRIVDPETGQRYEYRVTGATTFAVCATFGSPRDEAQDVAWNHPAGRSCFDFDGANPLR